MPDETEPVTRDQSGPSRRALLKGAAFGAGAVWVVPTILTIDASPAAASAAGCLDCGQNVIPPAVGDGTSIVNWTAVSNITASDDVFNNTSRTTQGSATYTRNFSTECTNRFGTQTPVSVTLAAALIVGHQGASSITARFYSGLGGTGSVLATLVISTAGPASPQTLAIPGGTQSVVLTMSLGNRNPGGQQPGTADNITLTLGTC